MKATPLVTVACCLLEGALSGGQAFEQCVVEREPVWCTAADLEPPDLGTGILDVCQGLVWVTVINTHTLQSRSNLGKRISEGLHAGAALRPTTSCSKITEGSVAAIKSFERRLEQVMRRHDEQPTAR